LGRIESKRVGGYKTSLSLTEKQTETAPNIPISIPVLDTAVLAAAEKIMRRRLKPQASHRVRVPYQTPMAVSKVQTPDFDSLVGAPGDAYLGVVADVAAHDGQLVAVEREEELEGIVVEELCCAVDW